MNGPAALISAGIGAIFFHSRVDVLLSAGLHQFRPRTGPDFHDEPFKGPRRRDAAAVRLRIHETRCYAIGAGGRSKIRLRQRQCEKQDGTYAGNKAFVYTVAIDFARIDDEGQIAQRHDAFKTCPMSAKEQRISDMKLKIPPGAIELAKKIQKAMPTTDESVLTDLSSQMSAGQLHTGANAQALRQAAGSPGGNHGGLSVTGGAPTGATFKPTLDIENEWRADRPPAAWPLFPADHPLSKPADPHSPARSIAVVTDVEGRWIQFKAGATKQRPSSEEMRQALRRAAGDRPERRPSQAWAVFVRLRKIKRDAG